MKMLVMIVCAGWVMTVPSHATPDHSVSVAERFFGSNETGYALIRTQNDNQGSYYVSREQTWLDEYAKQDTKREQPRSTLLLDVTIILDATHNDRYTPMPVTRTVNSKDDAMTMASLLERYPMNKTTAWPESDIEKMKVHPTGGIHFRGKQFVADSGFVSKVIFGERDSDQKWRLDGVSRDMNCIYLQLSVGQDSNPETRLMCVSPEISKCVNDQLTMESIYLVEGTYDAKDDALTRAKELHDLAREKKNYRFHPEVWSATSNTHKKVYLVAEAESASMIHSGWVAKTEEALGIDFTPMSSDGFERKYSLGGGD